MKLNCTCERKCFARKRRGAELKHLLLLAVRREEEGKASHSENTFDLAVRMEEKYMECPYSS